MHLGGCSVWVWVFASVSVGGCSLITDTSQYRERDSSVDPSIDAPTTDSCSQRFYRDADLDDFGDPQNLVIGCAAPDGYVTNNTDCNDVCPTCFPGSTEVCDSVDNNCLNGIDETGCSGDGGVDGCMPRLWYRDMDQDSYGRADMTVVSCIPPVGYTARSGDCNDSCGTCFEGNPETCGDGLDNNCVSGVDDGCASDAGVESGPMCLPLESPCASVASCCGGTTVECRMIQGNGAPSRCCIGQGGACASSEECCGAMACSGILFGGICQGNANGSTCTSGRDCTSGYCLSQQCAAAPACSTLTTQEMCAANSACKFCPLLGNCVPVAEPLCL